MKKFFKQNWFLIFVIVYIISPIDIIPDFLAPFLGPLVYADDASLLVFELVRRILLNRREPINEAEKLIIESEEVRENNKRIKTPVEVKQ